MRPRWPSVYVIRQADGLIQCLAPGVRTISRRNEISYPFGDIVEPLTCDDANFSGLVVPFRFLSFA